MQPRFHVRYLYIGDHRLPPLKNGPFIGNDCCALPSCGEHESIHREETMLCPVTVITLSRSNQQLIPMGVLQVKSLSPYRSICVLVCVPYVLWYQSWVSSMKKASCSLNVCLGWLRDTNSGTCNIKCTWHEPVGRSFRGTGQQEHCCTMLALPTCGFHCMHCLRGLLENNEGNSGCRLHRRHQHWRKTQGRYNGIQLFRITAAWIYTCIYFPRDPKKGYFVRLSPLIPSVWPTACQCCTVEPPGVAMRSKRSASLTAVGWCF